MTEPQDSIEPGQAQAPEVPKDKEAWKMVYFGQLSRDLVPYHPDPPEAPEDELTAAALADPDSVTGGELQGGPTLWRALTVVAVAIIALALVFWRR
jgi:hypothetical protein